MSTTPSPPPSPILEYNPGLPWASESSSAPSMEHAPHMRHPTSHPLFDPPSPIQSAPHCVSESSPLPSHGNQLPNPNAVSPDPQYGLFEPSYPIAGSMAQNPNTSNLHTANGSYYQENGRLNGHILSQQNYALNNSSSATCGDSNVAASLSPLHDPYSNQLPSYGQQGNTMSYVSS